MLLIKLWVQFSIYIIQCVVRTQHPLTIDDNENLGRELFSKAQFSSNNRRVKVGAFEPPHRKNSVSMNRLSLVSRDFARDIGMRHGEQRGRTFYGFGEILAKQVRNTTADTRGKPVKDNPFHANIQFPPDDGKDLILDVARQLAEQATFVEH